jgi:pyruvate,water dikinase
MAVVVQEMAPAARAGVAFAADPATGRRDVAAVSAVWGLGEGLVSEAADADSYAVDAAGAVSAVAVPEKRREVVATPDGGTAVRDVPPERRAARVLSDDEARLVADAARRLSAALGAPQDVEWCFSDAGGLLILQTRPITTLPQDPATGPETVWDNANIVESYPGLTGPLTFSFIRAVYTEAYRQFCLFFGVERRMLDDNRGAFEMLGLVRGRVYYNLLNWYRVLRMLPGYDLNARFMERMMGVREALAEPPEIVPSRRPRALRAVAMGWSLVSGLLGIRRATRRFRRRFDALVAPLEEADLASLPPERLRGLYAELERTLLPAWRTPLANDFYAMVFHGLLAKTAGDRANDLLVGVGDIVSAEPAARLRDLAGIVRADPALRAAVAAGDLAAAEAASPAFRDAFRAYVRRFGSRVSGELKLETVTYAQDPAPLFALVAAYAEGADQPPNRQTTEPPNHRTTEPPNHQTTKPPNRAEAALLAQWRGHPLKRAKFRFVLRRTRELVAGRENMRFDRTRLFAVVRRVFLALGEHLARAGRLDDARDVLWLERDEVFGAFGETSSDLRVLVAKRRADYAAFAAEPAPPSRFRTRLPLSAWRPSEPSDHSTIGPSDHSTIGPSDHWTLKGLPSSPGRVRGRVRVVRDLSEAGDLRGRILAAERTDPGWGPVFPLCAGILVERGSVLSHAAILSRELGVPCAVGVAGLLASVRDGDLVELDGAAGTVRILESSEGPAA